jgi:hypothetical protein
MRILLLDPLSAIAYGEAALFVGKWLLIVMLTIGSLGYLLARVGSLNRQFDGKPQEMKYAEQTPARQMQSAPIFFG